MAYRIADVTANARYGVSSCHPHPPHHHSPVRRTDAVVRQPVGQAGGSGLDAVEAFGGVGSAEPEPFMGCAGLGRVGLCGPAAGGAQDQGAGGRGTMSKTGERHQP